jgi:hypothetical protein
MEFKTHKLETIKNALQYAVLNAKTEKEEAEFALLLGEVQSEIMENELNHDITDFNGRIAIVNEIIKKIALLDRKFFHYRGKTAYIFHFDKRLYMKSEYSNADINLNSYRTKPLNWSHGGTLWGLIKDFKEFILTGEKSNGNNGYGGLHSVNWGYSESSMKEIRKLAKSLGYL